LRVFEGVRELRGWAEGERAAGRRLALVPTMGALHAGHLSLVELARRHAERVALSIFVNPAQFDDPADLRAYPRALASDLAACRRAGLDAVFCPAAEELYPAGHQTRVEVGELARPLCGAARPGHFRGVATVVAKLLLAARPHVAVFGEKDFQQLLVVRRMARDLCFDVEILGAPIAREPDGLALSSRNQLLSPEARRQAPALARALDAAERFARAGQRCGAALLHAARTELGKAPLLRLDYAELRDPETLEPAPEPLAGPALLALAAFFPAREAGAEVRLIDNRVLRAA
jgi:pantoate--beta-alanine ligase